jgi:F0F1-type ATP synthase assembly protein I
MNRAKITAILRALGTITGTVAVVLMALYTAFPASKLANLNPWFISGFVLFGVLAGLGWVFREPIKRRLSRRVPQ